MIHSYFLFITSKYFLIEASWFGLLFSIFESFSSFSQSFTCQDIRFARPLFSTFDIFDDMLSFSEISFKVFILSNDDWYFLISFIISIMTTTRFYLYLFIEYTYFLISMRYYCSLFSLRHTHFMLISAYIFAFCLYTWFLLALWHIAGTISPKHFDAISRTYRRLIFSLISQASRRPRFEGFAFGMRRVVLPCRWLFEMMAIFHYITILFITLFSPM